MKIEDIEVGKWYHFHVGRTYTAKCVARAEKVAILEFSRDAPMAIAYELILAEADNPYPTFWESVKNWWKGKK